MVNVYVFPDLLTKVAPGIEKVLTPVLSVISAVIVIVSLWEAVVTEASLDTAKLEIVGCELSVLVIVITSLTVVPLPAVSTA